MVDVKAFYESLQDQGISFFTGVPDSLLKNFCAYLTDHSSQHVIAANEGNSIALAAGYYLATGNPSLVYMQNSGIGNAVNPLLSLTDPEVYSIPMVLLIGWRGEPGKKDEPQHKKQGAIITDLLDTMDIPYKVLDAEEKDADALISSLVEISKKESKPVAIVVRKGAFGSYKLQKDVVTDYDMNREEAIEVILDYLEGYKIVSTTGKTSREVFELREARNEGHNMDFLTVGSMGHSSQIALGIALARPEQKVCCLDGDGAALMQMGGMGIIGQSDVQNYLHILVNNGAHDSVGGQPTIGFEIDFGSIAKACGYDTIISVNNKKDLLEQLKTISSFKGKTLVEVKVNKGAREDLGRPTTTPIQNRDGFMKSFK